MKSKIISLKNQIIFSNFWVRNGLIIIILSILVNHLYDPKYFPLNEDYNFPFVPILVSVVSGFIIILIARLNYKYFQNKYFIKRINTQLLLYFLISTLGYITVLYVFLYYGLNGLINGVESYSAYHLLTGLSLTLLICTIAIALLFSVDIYKLHKFNSLKGTLKVQHGGKFTLINYLEIAFIYSENKIVYIVKTDGTIIITDFTLNELEDKLSEQSFFRANRQIIVHVNSIQQLQSIENGKLIVLLKPEVSVYKNFQITISRYKKQAFISWFENKT